MKRNLMDNINVKSPYQEMTLGGEIYGGGNSECFKTGDWRINKPVLDEDKCKQCCICALFCPDVSIKVVEGKRQPIDYEHCKGCGICSKVCPFGAIQMVMDKKEM